MILRKIKGIWLLLIIGLLFLMGFSYYAINEFILTERYYLNPNQQIELKPGKYYLYMDYNQSIKYDISTTNNTIRFSNENDIFSLQSKPSFQILGTKFGTTINNENGSYIGLAIIEIKSNDIYTWIVPKDMNIMLSNTNVYGIFLNYMMMILTLIPGLVFITFSFIIFIKKKNTSKKYFNHIR